MPPATPDADPPEAARRGRYIGRVVRTVGLCREHSRIVLRLEDFAPTRPGQFLQVKCRDVDGAPVGEVPEVVHGWPPDLSHSDLLGPTPILRRPFSLAGRRDVGGGAAEVDLISRDVGPGTAWLARLQVGDPVDVIGPLGNGFELPEPGGISLLVGGGVGIPPMIYLAQAVAALNDEAGEGERRPTLAFCGATTLDLLALTITDDAPAPPPGRTDAAAQPLYNVAEFSQFDVPAVVSTDDGSYGFAGRVTDTLERYLDAFFADTWEVGSRRPTVYTCGPEAMMKAVAEVARRRGLACQVAVERAMACGMGTCQSCVIRQKAGAAESNGRGWNYRLACTHGPVFDAASLLW